MIPKSRKSARPRLLSPVIKSIKELKDPKGSHIRTIVKRVTDTIESSAIKPKPRNIAMHVKEALKRGLEFGVFKYFGGRYKLKSNDVHCKEEKQKKNHNLNVCHYCKKEMTRMGPSEEEAHDRSSVSSVSDDDESEAGVYSSRGCGRRRRRRSRSSCGKRRKRRRSSCGRKRRRGRGGCGRRRRRRSRCGKKRRRSRCGKRRRRSRCGKKRRKSRCGRRRRKSKVCLRMNKNNDKGDRNQDSLMIPQDIEEEFKSRHSIHPRQTKSPSNIRRSDGNSVEDLQQYDPSGHCNNPDCACAKDRRSRSRRSSRHSSRLERRNDSSKKDMHFLYSNESKE